MGFLGRLVLLAVGLLFAIPAGALVLGVAVVLDPVLRGLVGAIGFAGLDALMSDLADGLPPGGFALAGGLATGLFALLTVPPLLAALVGGVLGWRSSTAYGAATGLVTALMPWLMRGGLGTPSLAEGRVTAALFLAGAASGLVLGVFGRAGPRAEALSAPRR